MNPKGNLSAVLQETENPNGIYGVIDKLFRFCTKPCVVYQSGSHSRPACVLFKADAALIDSTWGPEHHKVQHVQIPVGPCAMALQSHGSVCILVFETGSTRWSWLARSFPYISCLSLQVAEITVIHHHAQ